jgi:hypothetical protein
MCLNLAFVEAEYDAMSPCAVPDDASVRIVLSLRTHVAHFGWDRPLAIRLHGDDDKKGEHGSVLVTRVAGDEATPSFGLAFILRARVQFITYGTGRLDSPVALKFALAAYGEALGDVPAPSLVGEYDGLLCDNGRSFVPWRFYVEKIHLPYYPGPSASN